MKTKRSRKNDTVLLVTTDSSLVRALQAPLTEAGYKLETCAAPRREPHGIAAAVLDLSTAVDPVQAVGLMRTADAPAIVVSSYSTDRDIVALFDAGADDVVVRPFSTDVLVARLRARARQAKTAPDTVVTSHFTVDLDAQQVRHPDGIEIHLTKKEWEFLALLATPPNTLVSQDRLLHDIWDNDKCNTGYLRVYLSSLRRKLEPDPANPRYLVTENGRGYRLDVPRTMASQQSPEADIGRPHLAFTARRRPRPDIPAAQPAG